MLFGSPAFQKVFLIRFFGYFFIQVGLLTALLIMEPVVMEESRYWMNQLLSREYILPQVVTSEGQPAPVSSPEPQKSTSGFGDLIFGSSEIIAPVSTDFGIVIEKINANAKVVADVDPSNENEYSRALSQGVAHAKGTVFPGQKGNIYLFSHSTDAPWNIVRYNAIFYLLSKMEVGDRVVMFYQGRRFDYIIFDKVVAQPADVSFLTNTYDESVLTLQTCDPPGTLINRLIVRARLAGQ